MNLNNLTIINKSDFPTIYLKILTRFCLSHTPINWPYTITFKNWKIQRWSGTSWYNQCIIRMNRHLSENWPYKYTDTRISYGPTFIINNRTELMIKLISHELAHSFQSSLNSFSKKEFLANDFAYSVVEKFRKVKYDIWKPIIKTLRKQKKHVAKI